MKRLRNILVILVSLILIILTVDALVDFDFLNGIQESIGDIAEVDADSLKEISNPLLP
ncbi:MAG: hypothetical protein AAF696_14805 [Bacteroidota bacterium]